MRMFRENYKILIPPSANGDAAVLIHGLFAGAFILRRMADFFLREGYRIFLYDYPTRRKEIRAHCSALADFLHSDMFDSCGKIHFITHSMGGLLLRGAVGGLLEKRSAQLGRAVMIAPPNRGSDLAAMAVKLVPGAGRIVAPIHDLSSAPDSFANVLPVPENMPETGIIAASHDHQVRTAYTHLSGEKDHIVLRGTHTGILFRRETAQEACHFIKFGKFREETHDNGRNQN